VETHGFFKTLAPEHLVRVVEHTSEQSIEESAVLFHQDQPAEDFYLLEAGAIEVGQALSDRWIDKRILQPGDLVGWSWLVPPYTWSVSGRAVEDCRVFRFDGLSLLLECQSDAEFGYALLKRFAGLMGQRLATLHDPGVGTERASVEAVVLDAIHRVESATIIRKRNLAI